MLTGMKALAKDALSVMRQAFGLPHDKTRAQVRTIKATFDVQMLEEQRIQRIADAAGIPEVMMRAYLSEFSTRPHKEPSDWWKRSGADPMSLRDRETLYGIVRAFQPRTAVETGPASGTTSAIILEGIEREGGGVLHSVELASADPEHYGEAIPEHLRQYWTLHLQTDTPLLPTVLEEVGQIDFFLHDSRHTYQHMIWEYELAWEVLQSGGCLTSHDVVVNSAFETFCTKHERDIRAKAIIGNFGFCVKR